jgi:hypothetical protein
VAAKKGKKAAPGTGAGDRGELAALLPELDDEGIAFLLEQARTLRHNMEVERLNAEADRAEERGGGREAAMAPVPARPGAERGMRVERSSDGATYHIVADGAWKMFAAEEMAALVRMTREDDPEEEIGRRLYAWLARERRDALGDLGISRPSSPALVELVRLLKRTFPASGGAGKAIR